MKKINKHKIPNSGFKAPDNYFNSFEENLLTELKLKDQVSNTGMEIPVDYFKNFKVENPIENNLNAEPNVISLFRNQKWFMAASIAAIFIMLITIPFEFKNDSLDFASIDNDVIENYILNTDFDTTDFNNLITNTNTFENIILEETLNDVILDDYMYNNINLEDLNIE